MSNRRMMVIAFMLILIRCAAARAGDEPIPAKLPERVEQFIRWLPLETETIIVSQAPFELAEPKDMLEPVEVALRMLSCGTTLGIRDDFIRKELKGQKIVCAVEGSCRFRSPKSLGMMPYDGCEIVCFSEDAKAKLGVAFERLLNTAKTKEQVAGTQVAVFHEKLENDDWTFFVAHPRPEILLCATERGYIKEVLERMAGGGKGRALSETLPEWSRVDVKAPVWGVRHYQKENALRDPSSPLNKQAAANHPDPDAVGFVFWYEPGKVASIHARYLSHAKGAAAIVMDGWDLSTYGVTPRIRQSGAVVVDISAPFKDDEGSWVCLLVLMGYLGHAVYL
jgi:hypothetical protein